MKIPLIKQGSETSTVLQFIDQFRFGKHLFYRRIMFLGLQSNPFKKTEGRKDVVPEPETICLRVLNYLVQLNRADTQSVFSVRLDAQQHTNLGAQSLQFYRSIR